MNTSITKSILASAIVFTIAGCTTEGSGDVAGIGGSGYVSSGSVSGFGSVFVNGVEFETDSSTFDVDGVSGTQDDLAIGMVVQVSGSINDDGVTGNATNISFDDELQGPVQGPITYDADRITASFTVLGVNVIIDSGSTTFDVSGDIAIPPNPAFGFDTIEIDNNVEISGFVDSNDNLKATRIELKDIKFDMSSIIEIKGTISALNGSTFNLGNLSVDASAATLDDLPNGLEDGLFVEVKGTFDTNTDTVKANKVEAEDDSVADTDEFELEGIITDYVDDSNFKINGIPVDASNATREPSSLILANDAHIEAEGAIVNGTLVASEIESEGGDIKVHATVTAVPPVTAPNTFELSPLSGQIITVTVTTGTQLEDSVNDIEPFMLSNLVANTDFVEVRGFDDGNGGITAVEVDIRELNDVIVQGNATAATGDSTSGTITVLGITFNFDNSTGFEDENEDAMNGNEINSLISDIKNTSTAPRLIKIEDNIAGVNAVGIADKIDIE